MADRTCPACATNDDHPRHIAVTESGSQAAYHIDCHAARGCPVCIIANEGAEDLRGDDRRSHLNANGEEIRTAIEALPEQEHNQVFGKVV